MTSWRCWIPGEPRSTAIRGDVVRLKDGRTFQKKNRPEHINRIVYFASQARPPAMLDGPLFMEVIAYRTRPKSLKKGVRYPMTRPDWDNIVKGLADALAGIVYADDAAIVAAVVRKEFADEQRGPGTDILVRRMET